MESFKFLDESEVIRQYQILDFISSASGRYFKLQITFIDYSILIAREFSSKEERNYSFHWMDEDKNLIIRWDNAPYHRDISSYPHHKHIQNRIAESHIITLEEVIQYIEKQLKNR